METTTTNADSSPIPSVILGDVVEAIREIRAGIEAGGNRLRDWAMPMVTGHLSCETWRGGTDVDSIARVMESGEWVPWVEAHATERALAALSGWVGIAAAAHPTTRTPKAIAKWIRANSIAHPYRVLCPAERPADPNDAAALPMWLDTKTPSAETITFHDAQRGPPVVVEFRSGKIHGTITVGLIPLHAEVVSPATREAVEVVCGQRRELPAGVVPDVRVGWTLIVGMTIRGVNPKTITEEEKVALWRAAEEAVGGGGSPATGVVAPMATTEIRRRQALLAETSLDRSTKALLDAWGGQAFPTTSSQMRPWSDIVETEIQRLRIDLGDVAFRGVPDVRKPLLQKVGRQVNGEVATVVELTPWALRQLRIKEGARGFRESFTTKAGEIEYLVKVLPGPDGSPIEIRLSWDRGATALSPAALGETKEFLDRSEKEEAEDLYKPTAALVERRRAIRDRIAAVEDARTLFELVIRMWGLDRSRRVVPIPRWEAAALLDIADDDRDGLQRITNALSAMRGIEFHSINYDTEGKPRGHAEGSVVAAFMWGAKPSINQRGRGNPGVDPDTIIGVELTELGMGMVRAFYTGNTKADSGRGAYLKTNTLSPFTSRAARWNRHQQRLADHLRHNITTNTDAAAPGRERVVVNSDRTPRRYGRDFCPLLPDGEWVGALGHFTINAEAGWRLDSKGGKGLLAMMGRPVPRTAGPGRWGEVVREAFADLTAVIEVMGGVAFGNTGGRWLRLEDVAGLPNRRPLEVPLFVFLPPDYARREAEVVEAHHRGRVERGETTTLMTVTEDAEAYRSQLRDAERGQEMREEVRALRRSRKVSRDALAAILETHPRRLSRWEAGNAELPTEVIDRLREWCRSGV